MKSINSIENPLPQHVKAEHRDFIDLTRSHLSKYNEVIIKQFGYLDNQGLALDDDEGDNGLIYIDQLYVLPRVSFERISPENLASLEMENQTEEKFATENIGITIWNNPRLTLLGDPGVGKTTLIQWLICSLCHSHNNFAKDQLGNLFPFVLTARKLSNNLIIDEVNNDEFIDNIIRSQGEVLSELLLREEAKKLLIDLFRSGQLILLVDGLDEISAEMSSWLSIQLRKLLTEYPKIRLLLTARVVGFDNLSFWGVEVKTDALQPKTQSELDIESTIEFKSDINFESESVLTPDFEQEDFYNNLIELGNSLQLEEANLPSIYYLAPFTPEQRTSFAENWMKNYLPPSNEKRQQFINGINEVSKHSLQLNALSRIPVLLNLICFILFRRGKLPNGRAELYQRIVETYLVTMDRVRSINRELSDEYDYHDIKNWLGKLALQMQAGNILAKSTFEFEKLSENELDELREQTSEIKEERLLQIDEHTLKSFLNLQLTEAVECKSVSQHSEQLIDYIKHRTGFIIPRGQVDNDEIYGFSHLSFQEYFSAYAISKILPKLSTKSAAQSILYTITLASWSEIWQLVFEELSLNGSSRREIEQYIDLLFSSSFSTQKFRSLKRANKQLSVETVLYAKLINNSAIKLSSSKRESKQIELSKFYLTNDYAEDLSLDETFNQVMKNEEKFIFELRNVTYIAANRKCIDNYSWLNKLTKLTELNLDSSDFEDLSLIENLTELKTLFLGQTYIRKLSSLAKLTKLEYLYIHGTEVSDLRPLGRITTLKDLSLGNTNIKSIKSLKNLVNLERLLLRNTKVTDFSELSGLINLKKLSLDGTKFRDLKLLRKMEGLKELNLDSTSVEDLTPLKNLTNLSTLSLINCKNLDYKTLESLPSLFSLTLPEITNKKLKAKIKNMFSSVTFVKPESP